MKITEMIKRGMFLAKSDSFKKACTRYDKGVERERKRLEKAAKRELRKFK